MITMIRKPATPEAETREQTSRRLSVETAILAEKSEAAPEAEVKPAPPAKKKAATVVRKKTAGKPRQVKWVEARDRRDLNVEKARLMTSARYYMEKMDFDNVRTQLKSLVNIDPKNTAYKKMLRRVETVLKTETEKE
jgi:DNA-binding SARP family transcriptional activator